jgi:murein DD-endopeptidase MepM/ murein hydrolase activator NlpD
VNKGDKVKKGQIIGEMGNTGLSTGTHLHYEVLKDNKNVNPNNFLHLSENDIKVSS